MSDLPETETTPPNPNPLSLSIPELEVTPATPLPDIPEVDVTAPAPLSLTVDAPDSDASLTTTPRSEASDVPPVSPGSSAPTSPRSTPPSPRNTEPNNDEASGSEPPRSTSPTISVASPKSDSESHPASPTPTSTPTSPSTLSPTPLSPTPEGTSPHRKPSLLSRLSSFSLTGSPKSTPKLKRESSKQRSSTKLPRNSSSISLSEYAKNNKKDCSVLVKVFEARNLLQARIRKKESDRANAPMKRAQSLLMDVTSPNLMNFADTTDPYCFVQVDTMKMRTRTIEKKLNPFWCEEFTFEVADPNQSKIVIQIMDEKKFAQGDQPIGKIVIPINSVKDGREREQWIPVQPPSTSSKVPQLHVYIDYNTTSPKPMFSCRVLGGRNLGISGPGTEPFTEITWRFKDTSTKTERFDWAIITGPQVERELNGPLESVTFSMWRPRTAHPDGEVGNGSDSSSMSGSASSSSIEEASASSSDKHDIGSIMMPVVDLTNAKDSWLCLYPKSEGVALGDLRVKIKYTEEVVLPLENYNPLLEMLQEPSFFIVHTLGAVAKQNTREAVAYNLVRVFEKIDKGTALLTYLTTNEIDSTPNPDIIFRGNSLATKALDQYMKLIGMPYLHYVLQPLIKKLYVSTRTCEVDPSKLDKGEDLKRNWKNLIGWVQAFTTSIFESLDKCPANFREIFKGMRDKCLEKYPQDSVSRYTSVSGFIFLRFFCPAILAPKLFEICDDHPGIKQTRYLILIAKTLQNLANLVEFGGMKEEFMNNMNEFVVSHMDAMKTFIDNLSSVPPSAAKVEPPSSINLEKQLAAMYRHLMRHRDDIVEHHSQKGDPQAMEKMHKLLEVLSKLEADVKEAQSS